MRLKRGNQSLSSLSQDLSDPSHNRLHGSWDMPDTSAIESLVKVSTRLSRERIADFPRWVKSVEVVGYFMRNGRGVTVIMRIDNEIPGSPCMEHCKCGCLDSAIFFKRRLACAATHLNAQMRTGQSSQTSSSRIASRAVSRVFDAAPGSNSEATV